MARTSSNDSAGTWSRQQLELLDQLRPGTRRRRDEMIWPSLMNVGPSASAARRNRREMSAVLAEPADRWRCRRHQRRPIQGPIATVRRALTASARRPGGNRPGCTKRGHAGAGAGARLVCRRPPVEAVALDHPRGVVRERTPQDIRRSRHRHPSCWRGAGTASRAITRTRMRDRGHRAPSSRTGARTRPDRAATGRARCRAAASRRRG